MILIQETAFKAPASCPECLSESAKQQSIPTVPDLFITDFLVINQGCSIIRPAFLSLRFTYSHVKLGRSNVLDLL